MKRTSLAKLKHWQSNFIYIKIFGNIHIFGKRLTILYFKCQKANCRHMTEKKREKALLWTPLNLTLWDLKFTCPF